MQPPTLKIKNSIFIFFIVLVISNCKGKSDLENQITIKINAIDSKTKQPRINPFDTIEVRIKKFGFPTWRFVKVGEYPTDSSGSAIIKVDRTEENHFMLGGTNAFGSIEFTVDRLKDGQEVNIEVFPTDTPL